MSGRRGHALIARDRDIDMMVGLMLRRMAACAGPWGWQ